MKCERCGRNDATKAVHYLFDTKTAKDVPEREWVCDECYPKMFFGRPDTVRVVKL